MASILGGALMGFGTGLKELADSNRRAAEKMLEDENALKMYRAKKEIDLEFRERGSKISTGRGGGGGGRRSGGGGSSSTTSGGTTKGKPLSRGLTGDIMDWAEEQGMEPTTAMQFVAETERLKATGLSENQAWLEVLTNASRGTNKVEIPGSTINQLTGGRVGTGPQTTEVDSGYTGDFQYPPGHPGHQPGQLPNTPPAAMTMAPETGGTGFDAAPTTPPSPTPRAPTAPATPSGPMGAPKKGSVIDNYEFLGGDPNDQKNWRLLTGA